MNITFYTSDLHLSHRNIVNGKLESSRPFVDYIEMNEAIISNWNSIISKNDTTYVLGDVAFAITELKSLENVRRLNGRKILILGNHDYDASKYMLYFDKIMGSKELTINKKKCILTHIPVHESQLKRYDYNIHGHLHGDSLPDDRYICVSLEQNNYHPFTNDEIIERLL